MKNLDGLYETKAAKKAKRRIGLGGIVGMIAAFLLVTAGAAFAYMQITSNEAEAKVEAGTVVPLELGKASTVDGKKLFPGTGVAIMFTVKNTNPIPVTIDYVVAGSGNPVIDCFGATATEKSANAGKLSSSLLIEGDKLKLPTAVQLDAGESKVVTVANAVKLDKTATGGCAISGNFKLAGTGAGSGN